jgi:hypothetical protein
MAAPRWLMVVMVLALREIMIGNVLRWVAAPADPVRGREPDVWARRAHARSES